MIPLLPRQQLLGQHRECAALRGSGWGRISTPIYPEHDAKYWTECQQNLAQKNIQIGED